MLPFQSDGCQCTLQRGRDISSKVNWLPTAACGGLEELFVPFKHVSGDFFICHMSCPCKSMFVLVIKLQDVVARHGK
jgi:hypothetical protein